MLLKVQQTEESMNREYSEMERKGSVHEFESNCLLAVLARRQGEKCVQVETVQLLCSKIFLFRNAKSFKIQFFVSK